MCMFMSDCIRQLQTVYIHTQREREQRERERYTHTMRTSYTHIDTGTYIYTHKRTRISWHMQTCSLSLSLSRSLSLSLSLSFRSAVPAICCSSQCPRQQHIRLVCLRKCPCCVGEALRPPTSSAAVANAAKSFTCDCFTVANAHAVLASSCTLSPPTRRFVALANAKKSFSSGYSTVANAQAVFARFCMLIWKMYDFSWLTSW